MTARLAMTALALSGWLAFAAVWLRQPPDAAGTRIVDCVASQWPSVLLRFELSCADVERLREVCLPGDCLCGCVRGGCAGSDGVGDCARESRLLICMRCR